jgi:SAM-dependent methyltransferase
MQMKISAPILINCLAAILSLQACGQPSDGDYIYRKGDPNGIGKWYMGREIAHVMGYHGMYWLERPDRQTEEKSDRLVKNLDLAPTDIVADIGAGSGYHVFRMAGQAARVYAVDIQDEMLHVMEGRKAAGDFPQVDIVKGTEQSVNLPENSCDKMLLVDVYHEFAYPQEMLASMRLALRPKGRIYLVEFRAEDKWVPIKDVHKMTAEQARKEFEAAGFLFVKNIGNLPWQHCLIFEKTL